MRRDEPPLMLPIVFYVVPSADVTGLKTLVCHISMHERFIPYFVAPAMVSWLRLVAGSYFKLKPYLVVFLNIDGFGTEF